MKRIAMIGLLAVLAVGGLGVRSADAGGCRNYGNYGGGRPVYYAPAVRYYNVPSVYIGGGYRGGGYHGGGYHGGGYHGGGYHGGGYHGGGHHGGGHH